MPTVEPKGNLADPILSKAAVAAWLGVSQSTIDRWTHAKSFPPKLRLGPTRVGWQRSDIENWLAQTRSQSLLTD